MLKISHFARLGQISIKTLRYYDEMGLITPAFVDEATGYRYYGVDQLPRLHRILALKDLGFSLEEIGHLLSAEMSPGQIRAMLRRKQAAQQRVLEEQERLARVEARLMLMEQEGQMSHYETVLKRVEEMRVASVHEVIPDPKEIGPTFDRLFGELFAYLGQHGARPVGPALDLWHEMDCTESEMHDMHVEAAVPVTDPLPDGARVKVSTLPVVPTMACTIHHGGFQTISEAHSAVIRWIEANGYRICGPGREVYLQFDMGGDSAQYVTEIQYPVSRA